MVLEHCVPFPVLPELQVMWLLWHNVSKAANTIICRDFPEQWACHNDLHLCAKCCFNKFEKLFPAYSESPFTSSPRLAVQTMQQFIFITYNKNAAKTDTQETMDTNVVLGMPPMERLEAYESDDGERRSR